MKWVRVFSTQLFPLKTFWENLFDFVWHCFCAKLTRFWFFASLFSMSWKIRRPHRVTHRREALCVDAMTHLSHEWGTMCFRLELVDFANENTPDRCLSSNVNTNAMRHTHCLRVALTPPECICEYSLNSVQAESGTSIFIYWLLYVFALRIMNISVIQSLSFEWIAQNFRMQNETRAHCGSE